MQRESLEKLLESIRDKFNFVTNADNTLDGKAGTLLAFEIAITLGFLSFGLHGDGLIASILGLVGMIISIVILFYVNWPKTYITPSVNIFEKKEYLTKDGDDLLLQLISDAQNAFTKNNRILERKAKSYKIAIILLLISTILLILSIIL